MASSPSSKGPSSSKFVAKSSPSAKKPTGNPKSKAAQSIAAKAAVRSVAPPAPVVPAATAGMTAVDRVVWLCLHLLVFLVPVAISNFSWTESLLKSASTLPLTYDQFDIVKVFVMRAAALGGLAAWAFQFFFQGGKLRRTKVDWLIVGFLAWVLLTSILSISPATALFGKYRRFEGFFSFLTYAMVFFLTVQMADRPSRIRALTRTFLISGLIVAGYGVLQSLSMTAGSALIAGQALLRTIPAVPLLVLAVMRFRERGSAPGTSPGGWFKRTWVAPAALGGVLLVSAGVIAYAQTASAPWATSLVAAWPFDAEPWILAALTVGAVLFALWAESGYSLTRFLTWTAGIAAVPATCGIVLVSMHAAVVEQAAKLAASTPQSITATVLSFDPLRWGSLPFELNRAFSTFGNPDLLGGFLVFPLIVSIGMALSEPVSKWRVFYWITFLITVWCWVVAFVRGAWIGGAVGLVIFIVAAILAGSKLHKIDWSFIGITGVAGSALVAKSLSNPNAVMNVWERLASIFKMEGSALTRFEIWQAAIDAIKARPIFGFGADTFRLVFPKYKPLAYVKDAGYLSVADNVHNYPLQLMAGIGIVGFVLLYGLFGWALWLGAPNAFSRKKGPERLVIAGFWAAAVGYIVHLMFGLSVTGSTVFLWLSLAMVVAPTARETQHRAPAWGAIAGTLLIIVLAIAWVGNFVITAADNVFLRGQFSNGSQAERIALCNQAIALNPYNDIYRSMLGKAYEADVDQWKSQVDAAFASGKDPSEAGAKMLDAFREAERTYKETIALVPTEYDNYLFLSALYNKVGQYFRGTPTGDDYFNKALEAASEGIVVEPFGPGVRLQKAQAQASLGDLQGALDTVMLALPMDPAYTDPRALAAQLLAGMGRYSEAADQYREILKLQPGAPGLAEAIAAMEASAAASTTSSTPATGTKKP